MAPAFHQMNFRTTSRTHLIVAVAVMSSWCCSSQSVTVAPARTDVPVALALNIDGQVVGSGIRELVVSIYNTAPQRQDVAMSLSMPATLPLPGAVITGSMTCHASAPAGEASTIEYSCLQTEVPSKERAIARFPIANAMADISTRAWVAGDPSHALQDNRTIQLSPR